MNPLKKHLEALEGAVFDWLELQSYEDASIETQVQLRREALMPGNMKAEMPEPYRLWRACERHNKLFWDGGIADQPHILMMEFSACERATQSFQKHIEKLRTKLHG